MSRRPAIASRQEPRTAPASGPPRPSQPLFAAVLTPTTCTGWCVVIGRYTRTFFLALPPPPPLLPAGFAFLSSFLGGILRSHRASRQRSVPSTRREAMMCASSGSDLRPGKASHAVRQLWSDKGRAPRRWASALHRCQEGRLGLHAAAGLSRLSGRLLSREMCGQVRQAGPQAWRDAAIAISTLEGRRVYEGRKARPLWLRESRRIIKHINEARKTRGGCRTGPCPVISTPVRLAPLPDYQTLWRRLPDWPLPRHLYPCTVRLDQEWTSGPDSLAAPRQAPRGSAR